MKCRHCKNNLNLKFLDLGFAPPSNAYIEHENIDSPEIYLPLKVDVCDKCWLIQTEDYTCPEDLFKDNYAYLSSTSTSWCNHAKNYASMIINKLNLNSSSLVIEVASNDGYLLKHFCDYDIPNIGIEPTREAALIAINKGINVVIDYYTENFVRDKLLRKTERKADLIVGNNVYAHVPDINDFTRALKEALSDEGTITLEFPHALNLIKYKQFDTIYHEHFSYLSLIVVERIFASCGLKIWDVEELSTHGGSLRVYGCHQHLETRKISDKVAEIKNVEISFGLTNRNTYEDFQFEVIKIKNNLLSFLIDCKNQGKKVVAYGAAAKGNTLLNYAGVKPDLIEVVFDASPSKHNKYLPGSHIPIKNIDEIPTYKFDYLLILPWNLTNEIISQQAKFLNDGQKFVTAVPKIEIL